MSKYISKIFSKKEEISQVSELPIDFAQQVLSYDIQFLLSNFTNQEALGHLVRLYMKAIEYYETLQSRNQEYYKFKLHWLMGHPNLLLKKEEQSSETQQIQIQMHYPSLEKVGIVNKLENEGSQDKVQVQVLMNNLRHDERTINRLITNDFQKQKDRFTDRLRERSCNKTEQTRSHQKNKNSVEMEIQEQVEEESMIILKKQQSKTEK